MIEINGKPFLEYQIENIKQQKITDIVLCVGHLSKQIEDYFGNGEKHSVHIQYSYDGRKPLGPIGALKSAETFLNDTFFTLYGDSYVFVDYHKIDKYFQNKTNLALMTIYKNNDNYDKSNLIIKNDHVTQYGGKKTKDMTYIDYGVSLFRKQVLKDIPKDMYLSTKDLFSRLVNQQQLLSFEMPKRFYHIGTPDALQEFTDYIKQSI